MFTLLHVESFIGSVAINYPLQLFLVGALLFLGIYELYHFTRIGKGWHKR